MNDPETATVSARADVPSPVPTPTNRVRVGRYRGDCERCDAKDLFVVEAYDPEVYAGKVCAQCLVDGKASDTYGPDHDAMRPMMFVARGLLGEEPYATLLREADVQRMRNAGRGIKKVGEAYARAGAAMKKAAAAMRGPEPRNRHERRAAAAKKRRKP